MKLQSVSDEGIVTTAGRTVYRGRDIDSLSRQGRVPIADSSVAGFGARLRTARPWKSLLEAVVGRFPTANVWPVDDTHLIATVGRYLFRSTDGGATWSRCRALPPSSGQMGVLPSAFAVARDAVYLGEYPLADGATPRLLRSTDFGETWTTVRQFPAVRHLHGVHVDPYDDGLWLTTGDVDSACRLYRYDPADDTLDLVGGGSQAWRAVELALTEDAVLWGMDCVYADRNRVFKLPRDALDSEQPTPTVVHDLSASVFYATVLPVDGTEYVAFSTAIETGGDSTAPDAGVGDSEAEAAVVVSSSRTGFTEWQTLRSYRKRRCPVDVVNPGDRLPNANAYVFLDSAPDRGLFVNPYNTRRDDGRIVRLSPDVVATSRVGSAATVD